MSMDDHEMTSTSSSSSSSIYSRKPIGYPSFDHEITSSTSTSSSPRYSRKPIGYPSFDHEITSSSSSSSSSSSYSRKPIGYPSFDHDENRPTNYMIRWKSGKRVDQKLLNLLQSYFQELYVKRNDFFKKIFSDHVYDQFVDVFDKIGAVLSKNDNNENHSQTVQRSLSFSSTETRLEWFNVKTPDVVVVQPFPDSSDDSPN